MPAPGSTGTRAPRNSRQGAPPFRADCKWEGSKLTEAVQAAVCKQVAYRQEVADAIREVALVMHSAQGVGASKAWKQP